jgi:pimeloyl-ACP methyl ester carboxylesterase
VYDMGFTRGVATSLLREMPAALRMGAQVLVRPAQPLFTGAEVGEGVASLPPVLLLHGFAGVAAHVTPWKRALVGHQCYSLGYPSIGNAMAAAERVADTVEQLASTHDQSVAVVGHSLGGLLALSASALLQQRSAHHVMSACVTVCSPLLGANLPSAPLADLRRLTADAPLENLLTIAAEYDHVVSPNDAIVPGAHWALVRDAGHLSVISRERTLSLIAGACAPVRAAHGDIHAPPFSLPPG